MYSEKLEDLYSQHYLNENHIQWSNKDELVRRLKIANIKFQEKDGDELVILDIPIKVL